MPNVVLPIGINFKNWTDQIRLDLPNISMPLAEDVKDWRDWAAQVVNDNLFSDIPAPTELAFPRDKDWMIWASYFIDTVTQD